MGTALTIAGLAISAAGTAYNISSQANAPVVDTTDYDLLRQTQAAADAESEEARAMQDAAAKREALRQQQLAASGIKTSDSGTDGLSVTEQVLGVVDESNTTATAAIKAGI